MHILFLALLAVFQTFYSSDASIAPLLRKQLPLWIRETDNLFTLFTFKPNLKSRGFNKAYSYG